MYKERLLSNLFRLSGENPLFQQEVAMNMNIIQNTKLVKYT